jgi:microcystin-dependent protein
VSAQQDKVWCLGLVNLGAVSSWEDAEAVLQQQHLVHPPAAAVAQQAAGVAGEGAQQQHNMCKPYLHVKVVVALLD